MFCTVQALFITYSFVKTQTIGRKTILLKSIKLFFCCENLKLKSDEAGGAVFKFGPGVKVLITSDPEMAKFLLTLKPEMVEKAGLSDMWFGDDPKGFIGGLLYEEGAAWHRSRKIITEEFNQARVRRQFELVRSSTSWSNKASKYGRFEGRFRASGS